ncbi:DnaJ family domain-containing protein [Uliginosibacterium gangwonense]|uniref:DnaJ family domain-containing protein n=1 Tax=Uliginosibacterium gangwonense TaxID=392736 RepID=UPI00037C7B5E|nr:DnaJ family domain-containing protein [Uliginosibacterium gangwonense]
MLLLDALAERRIEEARDAGEFDDLPGAGKPLSAEDWSMVPEDERMAYRLLKNAGYLPPELELHREAVALALKLASRGEPSAQTAKALDRLARINMLLAEAGKPQLMVPLEYIDRIAGRL